MALDLLQRAYPPYQGPPVFQGIDPTFIPGEGLPMLQDGTPAGTAPGEEWLARLRDAGEKFQALQAFLDQAQGPQATPQDVPMAQEPATMGSPKPVPGWGVVLAGLGDLLLNLEDDYDPFTELPPTPSPSLLDKVTAHNLGVRDYELQERHRAEDRSDELGQQRSRERNVLMGTLLPHLLRDEGGKETDAEKIQGRIRLMQESIPGYDALDEETQRRLLLEMFPGASMANAPKDLETIEAEAAARARGHASGTPAKPGTDKISEQERKLYTDLYKRFVTVGEGGLVPTPLPPEEAHKRAMAAVERWRAGVGRQPGGVIGAEPPDDDLDHEGHLFVDDEGNILYPGDEGYDELAGTGGQPDMARIMADPRLSSAYQTITGARGFPPQPAARMGGFGDLLESQAAMGGAPAPGPGLAAPAAPAQPANLIKALAGFRLFVEQGGDVAKARLQFYQKYGVDPYELEQAAGPGR